MIRVAFTLIGGKHWTGGYNYLLNLVQQLARHQRGAVQPVLFFGTDVDPHESTPFAAVPDAQIVHSPLMDQRRRGASLSRALALGRDEPVEALFRSHGIDLVFESAQFFGSRLKQPAVAWIPDLQHRDLPHLFSRFGWWKRELGFRAQVGGGRAIMVSSEDSRAACERYYPSTRGRTHVVRFAVPPRALPTLAQARDTAARYGLPDRYVFLPNQFWKHKNHLLVVEALRRLRERGRPLVVAASGKQLDPRNPGHFESVEHAISQAGVAQDFRLLGLLPYEDLAPLAFGSLALLNPSHLEGWSTTVEEGRALGIPMVLSDLAVHQEQAGDAAIYFDRFSADALADALASLQPLPDAERERRGQAALMDAERRTERFAAEFVQLARRACGRQA